MFENVPDEHYFSLLVNLTQLEQRQIQADLQVYPTK